MASEKAPKKIRGVYEHPKKSGIWWIQYFDHGRRRRERVGRKSDAATLYRKRRTQILLDEKLPELNRKQVTFAELVADALEYAREQGRAMQNYTGKADLLLKTFGPRAAESITAEDFAAWIRRRDVGAASFNRYRSFLSLCYREGQRHGKVTTNPPRQMQLKREPRGRKRFLTREEYSAILAKIRELHPTHAAEFVISVYTGMRLSEQFRLRWKSVDMSRREIHVVNDVRRQNQTKNGDDRTIPMASLVHETLDSIQPKKPKPEQLVFPRERGGKGIRTVRWFTDLLRSDEFEILDYTWHNNRHTFCSWLAIAGTPLRTIQELAGHRTIAMTARYAHLSPDHKQTEIEKLVSPAASAPEKSVSIVQLPPELPSSKKKRA